MQITPEKLKTFHLSRLERIKTFINDKNTSKRKKRKKKFTSDAFYLLETSNSSLLIKMSNFLVFQ